jgi:branched-chain amino acid transport system permease protein
LLAYYRGVVTTDFFTFDVAVQYIAIVIIGGLGSVTGSVLGSVFVLGLPYVVTDIVGVLPGFVAQRLADDTFPIQAILYGAAIIVFLSMEPGGLVALLRRPLRYVQTWPLTHELE